MTKCTMYKYGSSLENEYGYVLPSVPSCTKVYAVGFYSGDYSKAIKDYKFNGEIWIGVGLAEIMYDMAMRAEVLELVDIISYVPISDERLKSRGFDQSQFVAELLARKSGLPCVKILRRTLQGKTQSKSGRAERITQSKNRFEIDSECFVSEGIRGILIVDDIITTGATLEECASLIKESGIANIFGCVMATGRHDI